MYKLEKSSTAERDLSAALDNKKILHRTLNPNPDPDCHKNL